MDELKSSKTQHKIHRDILVFIQNYSSRVLELKNGVGNEQQKVPFNILDDIPASPASHCAFFPSKIEHFETII